MQIALGIDTGGTYTDAVLLADGQTVLASAKSLTTRHDLTEGIRGAIEQLPLHYLSELTVVSLSTTLATNAVVEEQGTPVLGIFAGYNDKQLNRVKIPDILGSGYTHTISGGHTATGKVSKELDLAAAEAIIKKHHHEVSAIAISSMFSVRNTTHEKALVELAQSICDKPVTCGHELAGALDAPRRALTAVLNARLVSFIKELIQSVEQMMQSFAIKAPLMIVKGDGSLVNAKTALLKPVETVLSGPAASVMGAALLSGQKNIIVSDMGGTTTDVAILRNGMPKVNSHGAKVGNWSPMINAIEVHAVGLGGDSEVRFSGASGLTIGPRRVMPMSLLCHQYPQVLERLKWQLTLDPSARSNRFVVRQYANPQLLAQLDDDERRAWEMMKDGPVELEKTAFEDRDITRAIARLHRLGMVLYSGFTPSDAAHVLGRMSHWSREGAELATQIWARQMRRVYGLGLWEADDIDNVCQDIWEKVTKTIAETLVKVGLDTGDYGLSNSELNAVSNVIGRLLWGESEQRGLFDLDFARDYTVIAVGAPARAFYPDVAKLIGCELIIPDNAEVSNAIGAVATKVRQRVAITITEAVQGIYRVHAMDIIKDIEDYDEAINFAQNVAAEAAKAKAKAAGAADIQVFFELDENKVNNSIDGDVFFEASVAAVAEGQPRFEPITMGE